MKSDLINSIQQSEYTGENRCTPCTILNVMIASVLSLLIARKSKSGGKITVIASTFLIYFRGYLIPGTPELTKRYLPAKILHWFGKESQPNVASGLENIQKTDKQDRDIEHTSPGEQTKDQSSVAFEEYFINQGIIEPCENSSDLCLTNEFKEAWSERMDLVSNSSINGAKAAKTFGFNTDQDEFELVSNEQVYTLYVESQPSGQWPSYSALVADVAASQILTTWNSEWKDHSPEQKGQLLNSLRVFLESCPTTDGGTKMSEEVVESCCSSQKVIAVTCEDTGERLFEHPIIDDI